jgi:hypothetical protein
MVKTRKLFIILTITLSITSILVCKRMLFLISIKNIDTINYYSIQNSSNRKLNNFFDLGANKGDSVLNFLNMNPSSQGGNINKKKRFNLTFEANEWIIYLFEANKYFNDQLISVKKDIEKLNHVVVLNHQTAAWTSDGQLISIWIQ